MRTNLIAGLIVPLFLLLLTEYPTAHAGESQASLGTARNAGRVVGTIVLSGEYLRPAPLRVVKSREFCGSTVQNETLLVGPGAGIRNAVVTLRPLGRAVTVRAGRVVLDNKQCAFAPHVQVATLGSELILKNSDPILHTVHARLGKDTLFNVGLPRWREVSKVLDKTGVLRIDCDVLHTWMSAAILVVTTPYFAVSDENGSFTIDGVPAGNYEVEIWHERLGSKSTRISVSENVAIALEMIYANAPR